MLLFLSNPGAGLRKTSYRAAKCHTACRQGTATSNTLRMANEGDKEGSLKFGGIQHAGVLVNDVVASKNYYMNVLGMEDDTEKRNPKLPFDGAFVRAGTSQIHLMRLPNPDPLHGRPEHGGRYVISLSTFFLKYSPLMFDTNICPCQMFLRIL